MEIDILKAIRALWFTAYVDINLDSKIASEFLYAVGDILEGTPPAKLTLQWINKDSFLKELDG